MTDRKTIIKPQRFYNPPGNGQSPVQTLCRFLFLITAAFVFSSFSLVFSQVEAGHFKFENFSIDQGLSQSTVTCILRDSRGLMWFGTEEGVNKFDGYTFTIYKPKPDDPGSLSHTRVFSICEDRGGDLWVGTLEGLNKYNRETETFIHYKKGPVGLSDNQVVALEADRENNIWIGTRDGLNKWNRDTGQITIYKNEPGNPRSLSHNRIRGLCIDREGNVWIGTRYGGLNLYNPETDDFTRYVHNPADPVSINANNVYKMTGGGDGTLWAATSGGLARLDIKTGKFTRFVHEPGNPGSISSNLVISVYRLDSGVVLAGTDKGLNVLLPGKKSFILYRHIPQDAYSLSHDVVMSIYRDPSDIIWVGTEGGGVNKFSPVMMRFPHYRFKANRLKSGLSGGFVYSVFEDRERILWVGTDDGLTRVNRRTEPFTYTHFQHDTGKPHTISSNNVTALLENRRGEFWVGTWDAGLNKFDRATGKFYNYQPVKDDDSSISHSAVKVIYEDKYGVLWLGTEGGGLNRFNRENNSFMRFMAPPEGENTKGLSNNYVHCLTESPAGVLWIGTAAGLNRFDTGKGTWKHYINVEDHGSDMSSVEVSALQVCSSGYLWVGTYGTGLNHMDPTTGEFTQYRLKDGLPNEVIYGIKEDNNRNLWLSTNRGLSCFNPKKKTFRNFSTHDGVQDQEFNIGASFKSPYSGELFFGGINGLNAFFPGHIKNNPHVPPVVITDFKLSNDSVPISPDGPLKKSIMETRAIELSHEDYVFSFEFAALDFSHPPVNRYAYMMEGLDEEWVYCGTRRSATYTTLEPGDYTFRVKASNNDNIWNEEGTWIKLTITPPYYKTWWFRIMTGLLVIALVVILYKFRTHTIRKRNRQLEEMNVRLNRQYNEKQAAEGQVRKSERRLRTFLQTAGEGFLEVDRTETILDVNPEMCTILNRQRDDIVGKKIIEFVEPHDLETFEYNTTLRKAGKKSSYNLTLLRPGNTPVHCLIKAAPLFDEHHQVKGSFAMVTDITHIIQAEKQLKQTKNYLDDVFNSLSSMLVSVDLGFHITQWNTASENYFNIPAAKAVSRKVWKAVPFLTAYRDKLNRALKSREPVGLHREIIELKPGEKKYLDILISPLTYSGQAPEGLVIRMDDVTELERKDRQLLQAQKMEIVGNLAGGLAHDFNNVLGGIVGNISLMKYLFEKNRAFDQEKIKNRIDMMDRESHRAVEMVKRLLTLSRKNDPQLAPVNLNRAMEHVMKICENTFDKSITLDFGFHDGPAMILADATQIEQLLLNLCLNASHAMTVMREGEGTPGGILSVTVESFYSDSHFCSTHSEASEGNYWDITVRDTGVGMDIKTISHIFEPFFTTKKKGEGTGLGLAMVYNIVQQHKGFIDVLSHEGTGSTFNVFLPQLEQEKKTGKSTKESKTPVKGSGLILVIDDEESLRETAREMLEICGYEVILAADGHEGIELYKKHKNKIKGLILDMAMANLSGKDTYIEIKKINPNVKVLLVSGFKQDQRVKEALQLGINDFLQKPYSITSLSSKLSKILKD